jgi:hypothetical protein
MPGHSLLLRLSMAGAATALALSALAQPPRPAGTAATADTPHLTVATTASAQSVAPGGRLSLLVDIAPKPRMHVYAPEEKVAIPVSLTLAIDALYKADPPTFPKGEELFFEALKLTQIVYSKPFRITQNITLVATPAVRDRVRAGGSLMVKGTLRYQACDDKVCYAPKNVPLSWTLSLKPER